jgi:hypothetical protein
MYWGFLIGLFIISFPINAMLLNQVWYKWYPIEVYQLVEEPANPAVLMKAQGRAIMLFGFAQPLLAATPLLFGNQWWQYLICILASAGYSASGSPRFFVDRVRSSYFMRLGTLVSFAIGATVFTIVK